MCIRIAHRTRAWLGQTCAPARWRAQPPPHTHTHTALAQLPRLVTCANMGERAARSCTSTTCGTKKGALHASVITIKLRARRQRQLQANAGPRFGPDHARPARVRVRALPVANTQLHGLCKCKRKHCESWGNCAAHRQSRRCRRRTHCRTPPLARYPAQPVRRRPSSLPPASSHHPGSCRCRQRHRLCRCHCRPRPRLSFFSLHMPWLCPQRT